MSNPLRQSALVFFALFAIPQNLAHGTALVIVRTNEGIVVAADSRATDVNHAILPDVCKIGRSGDQYFSIVGQASWRGVDFFQIIDKELATPKSLVERLKTIRDGLVHILDLALQSDPAVRAVATEQGSVMGVAVYGFDHGTVAIHHTRFALKDPTHVDPQIHECPGVDCPDGRVAITAPPGTFDWSIPTITAAREWVQREINKKQPDIGGPVQLLRIGPNGESKWIEKPEACKDQK
jgi:hypothetical protein